MLKGSNNSIENGEWRSEKSDFKVKIALFLTIFFFNLKKKDKTDDIKTTGYP